MNFKRILAAVMVMVLSLSMFAGCGSSKEATTTSDGAETSEVATETRTVNIAVQPSAAFIPLYIAREYGWVDEALNEIGVTAVWNDFESGPPMNESLAAGSSDIGVLGDVPCVSALAAGQQNEIVATAADGAKSYAMLVGVDSDIETAADLKGKKIGTTVGSTGHNLTDKLLKTVDLDINTDVELVNITTGDAAAVLANGEVDAVAIWEPNVTRLVENGTAKIIAEGTDCGLLGVNPIVARAEYAQANPDVMKVIIEQYARGVQALKDLDEEVAANVAEYLSLETEQLQSVAAKYDYNVTISEDDVTNLQDTIAFLVKIGVLTEEIDVAPYVNSSYLESADIDQYLK